MPTALPTIATIHARKANRLHRIAKGWEELLCRVAASDDEYTVGRLQQLWMGGCRIPGRVDLPEGDLDTAPRQRPRGIYPLHVITTSGIDLVAIAAATVTDNEDRALRWLHDPELYRSVLRGTPREHRTVFNNYLEEQDIDQLLNAGIISEIQPTNTAYIKSWVKLFTLLEEQKRRRRVLMEPRDINRNTENLSDFGLRTHLPSLKDIEALVRRSQEIISVDYRCFYFQIGLHGEVPAYYGVKINSRNFVINRLPMGVTLAVCVAQHISTIAARHMPGTHKLIYIDNTFIGAQRDEDFTEGIHNAAAKFNIEIGTYCRAVQLDVLGVRVDCQTKTMKLGERFVERHTEFVDHFQQNTTAPVVAFWRGVGVLLRTCTVLKYSLAHTFFLLRRVRIIARALQKHELRWSDNITYNEEGEEAREIATLCELFRQNKAVPIAEDYSDEPSHNAPKIFSDASMTGWGVVVVSDSHVHTYAGTWTEEQSRLHIAELEAIAFSHALKYSKGRYTEMMTDNAALYFAIRRGHSANRTLNEAVLLWGAANTPKITLVPSAQNLADGASRGIDTTPSLSGGGGGL
jgi:hypothetical protein